MEARLAAAKREKERVMVTARDKSESDVGMRPSLLWDMNWEGLKGYRVDTYTSTCCARTPLRFFVEKTRKVYGAYHHERSLTVMLT